jgi:hypothetical protein
MPWYNKKMPCCGPRKKEVKNLQWGFKHGSSVSAPTFEEALEKLEEVSSKDFWASETHTGYWDVQLSNNVVHYNIHASSVIEAVKKARWNTHLDNSFKTLDNIYT